MSMAVPLDQLAEFIAANHGCDGYVITIAEDGRPRLAHVNVATADNQLRVQLGDGGTLNAEARSQLTVLFPAPAAGEMSLIVDGDAIVDRTADQAIVIITPTWAVRHRPAPG